MATIAHNNYRLLGTLAFLQDGSGQAGVHIYEGTMPATEEDALPGGNVKLATVYFDNPAGAIVSNKLQLSASLAAFNVATGVPQWAWYFNRSGVHGGNLTVSAPGDGGQVQVDVETITGKIYAGGALAIISLKFT